MAPEALGRVPTIITTTSLIPLEVYELVKRPTVTRGLVIVVNVAVVLYLGAQVRRPQHEILGHASHNP